MRVFILGYYGYKNTGDDAMVEGMSDLLRHYKIDDYVYIKGASPRHIKFMFKWCDTILVPGGTHLRNWGKGWFYQGLRMLLFGCFCRLLGKKFYMFNIGIDGKVWEWLARRVANRITIRDRESFDSAALMNFDLSNIERKKIIGVNLTPVNAIYYNDPLKDVKIAGAISATVTVWLKKHPDWSVKFISFNGHEKYNDDPLNQATANVLNAQFVPWQSNPIATLYEVAECSVMIGMRYHACVFAALARLPLLGIKSYPSIEQFMSAWYWHKPLEQEYVKTADFLDHFTAFMEVATMPEQKKYKPQYSIEQMKQMSAEGIRLRDYHL